MRLIKITGKEPQYRMELAEGKIEFPSVAKLISQEAVRVAVAATVGRLIVKLKPKHWDQLAQMLLDACQVEEGTEEVEWEGAAKPASDFFAERAPQPPAPETPAEPMPMTAAQVFEEELDVPAYLRQGKLLN